jgi:hypothetical protein
MGGTGSEQDPRDIGTGAVWMSEDNLLTSPFGEVIFAYTRADALRDGELVEIPRALAIEAGIRVPVAVTSAVWGGYISPHYLADLPGQSVDGRLWDLLWMFTLAARHARRTSFLQFKTIFVTIREHTGDAAEPVRKIDHETVTFKALCGPGDDGEPVITIMLPEED